MRLWATLSHRKLLAAPTLRRIPVRSFASTAPAPIEEDYQRKDIITGDLKATLEAHRASNRSLRIRKIEASGLERSEPSEITPGSVVDEDGRASSEQYVAGSGSSPPFSADAGNVPALTAERDVLNDAINYGEEEAQNSTAKVVRFASWGDGGTLDELFRARNISFEESRKIRRKYKVARARTHEARMKPRTEQPLQQYVQGKVVAIPPKIFDIHEDYQFDPWVTKESAKESNRNTKLSMEIDNLAAWLVLTPAERSFRQELTVHLMNIMTDMDDDLGFWQFGSSETGFATSMSDIDLGFNIRSRAARENKHNISLANPGYRKDIYRKLQVMLSAAVAEPRFDSQEIVFARYPLLRMQHRPTKTEVQIVANDRQPGVIEIIRGYKDEFPQLLAVFSLVKCTLAARGLDEPRLGGIGSYALLMWIVAAFRHKHLSSSATTSQALLAFMDFVVVIDTSKQCISVDPPRIFPKRMVAMKIDGDGRRGRRLHSLQTIPPEERMEKAQDLLSIVDELQPHLLCLQDPADQSNDLGFGVYRILDITKTLSYLRWQTKTWLVNGPSAEQPESPLEFMLESSLKIFKSRRNLLNAWLINPKNTEIARYQKSAAAYSLKLAKHSEQNLSRLQKLDSGSSITEVLDGWSLENGSRDPFSNGSVEGGDDDDVTLASSVELKNTPTNAPSRS